MSTIKGQGPISTANWPDFVHPEDNAFQQMAEIWARGIATGIDRGLLPGVSVTGDQMALDDIGAGPLSSSAAWSDAGVYAQGNVAARDAVRLLDFDGDGDDDYGILGSNGELDVWRNDGGDVAGGSGWVALGRVAGGNVGAPEWVRFLDFDGDGDDDYGVLGANGELDLWRNDGGDVPGGAGWLFLGRVAGGNVGAREWVRFLDFDADGDDDYGIIGPDGELTVWRNDGGDAPGGSGWFSLGRVAAGNVGERASVRFMDVDGDGDDDYAVLGHLGGMTVFRNDGGDGIGGAGWLYLGRMMADTGDGLAVRLADSDGDGDDDYQTIAGNGALRLWVNQM